MHKINDEVGETVKDYIKNEIKTNFKSDSAAKSNDYHWDE